MSHNYRDGGKGDKPRPFSVDLEKFAENFDLIFNNKEKKDGNKDNKKSTNTSTKEENND
jgi:hypothetical protein